MKLSKLFIYFLSSFTLLAGDVAVRFYGTNNPYGFPAFWPAVIQPDATSAPSGYVLITTANLDQCIQTNRAAYDSAIAQQAATLAARNAANMARLLALFDGIADARATLRGFANATNALTLVQLTSAVRQMADYQEKVMEFLQRLGPMLKAAYKPEDDYTP